MFDLHCHLLPGIDDGPQTLEDALALAQAAVADGITHAVATPHVFPGRFNNLRSTIEQDYQRFVAFLKVKQVPLKVLFAGEVRLDVDLLDLIRRDEVPFLGEFQGMKTLLLEFPDAQIPLGSEQLVSVLVGKGIRPLIAHPERNKAVMDKPERIRPFMAAGCSVQLTAGSILGQFGPRALAASHFMLEQGFVGAVASDAHNLEGRRHRMTEACHALEKQYGAEVAAELTKYSPARLCGQIRQECRHAD